jgi:SMODS and SLOG-associating 2TM effector domain 1/Protein of unknown function (DUF4231)
MTALTVVADRQALWSQTADATKKSIERSRWCAFVLSIAGALLATIASQLQGNPRLYVAIAGAVALAIVSIISARLITSTNVTNWVRARAASEALKRAAYTYAAGAAPYDDPASRDAKLNEERNRIDNNVDDLGNVQVAVNGPGRAPRAFLDRLGYIGQRVRGQIAFYVERANTAASRAKKLRWWEFSLSALATIITAVVGVAGKDILGVKFDLVSITAVLTTMAGAILAHIEASRYDFLVTSYRAAARALADRLADIGDDAAFNALAAADWSAFVGRCEGILSDENNGWVEKQSKAMTGP